MLTECLLELVSVYILSSQNFRYDFLNKAATKLKKITSAHYKKYSFSDTLPCEKNLVTEEWVAGLLQGGGGGGERQIHFKANNKKFFVFKPHAIEFKQMFEELRQLFV